MATQTRLLNRNELLTRTTKIHIKARSVTFHNQGTLSVRINNYPLAPGAVWETHCHNGETIDSPYSIDFDAHNTGVPALWVLTMNDIDNSEQHDI